MKGVFKKENLINALNNVSRAVGSKSPMSILECILIKADDNGVYFTATDSELGIRSFIRKELCTIEEKGSTALEAKLLTEISRKIAQEADSDILLTTDGSVAEITSENAKYRISEKDPQQFPELPLVEKENTLIISQYTLKEMIKETIFSLLANDPNKMMTGELFEVKDNSLRIVALDGHRVSIRKCELKSSHENMSVIIPGKTLAEVLKILPGDAEKDTEIIFSKNHALFKIDDTLIVTRLIDGEYFRIDNMLTTEYKTRITMNKNKLLESVEKSIILLKETDKKPLVLKIEENEMRIKMNASLGSLDDRINILKEGEDLLVGYNPKFIQDALRVIDEEEVSFYMNGAKTPCFIRNEEQTYIYMILPVNFNPAFY